MLSQLSRLFGLNSSKPPIRHIVLNKASALDQVPKVYRDIPHPPTSRAEDDIDHFRWYHKVLKYPSTINSVHPIEYLIPEHTNTWSACYHNLKKHHQQYACDEHLKAFKELEEQKVLSQNEIPQFNTINKYLESKTGFKLANIGGLLSPRVFLNGLGFGFLYAAQFIRTKYYINQSIERDIVHDLLGHLPMLTDKKFADFSREIGRLSLKASDQEILAIEKIYVYAAQLSFVKEKMIGTRILGSFLEIQHGSSKEACVQPWRLKDVLGYEISYESCQNRYVDIGSVDNLKMILEELKEYLELIRLKL